ncbi:FG-GAP-like repeat-containing protein [Granulicella sp. L46]|uniref:FG-GAP-like repeat-containing protein n=1 Tax=Granulicella sp. L46 TaxID=1641865 RepID=UPI00131DF149|nr:FG-GAP-like repeat-containing protein [Granulicella sp. L46]
MRFLGVVPFLAMVVTLAGCSGSSSIPISLSLTSTPKALDQGLGLSATVTATLANDTSGKGVVWGLAGVGSLSSSTGTSVTYSPPTTSIASAQQITVTATSVAEPTQSASIQITVNPYPVIPFQSIASGTAGVAYSQPITLTGGTAPFHWSVYNGSGITATEVGGSLPDGLTLNAATGMISGTPTGAGTWFFDGTVTDADGASASNELSIQINPAGSVTANPVPFLNQPLVPSAVSPGSSGTTLKVSGTGFVSGATVDFNGTALATTFVDREHLSAVLPATDVAAAGTASVTVVNPAPGGDSSNAVYFQVGTPQTTVNFANAQNSPLQIAEPAGLAIADFNQDGKADLAVAANVRLYTMLGNGDGTFAGAADSPVSIPSPPYDDFASPYVSALTVGDFNHSGHSGLAVAEFQNEAAVILLGNGTGALVTSSATFANAPGFPMSAIETADFNADGNLDLALIDSISGISQVDLGYGNGAFNAAGQIPSGSGTAVGDFNGDGKLDVAVVGGGGVVISLGNGDGTFTQTASSPIQVGYGLSSIAAGDFNGDGKLDVAVTDEDGNAVRVLVGNGDGTFQPPITIAVGNGPAAMVVGDFNNDGKLDLATANNGDGTVTLLLGKGDGTFIRASTYTVGKGPDAIAAADFNGDGKLDLAVANGLDGTGSVSILLQQ